MTDQGEVIIVSGLPRSGTSMLMGMLAAGGCETLSDDVRKADADNPNGYFECQSVKGLARDNSIFQEAKGKAIKVVSPLLQHLPEGCSYRVIFLRRSLEEVIDSQKKMLTRNGNIGAHAVDLQRSFTGHLAFIQQWLAQRSDVETMYLRYADVVKQPGDAAVEISRFLNRELSIPEMVAAVDQTLYRNVKCGYQRENSNGAKDYQKRARVRNRGD